MKRKLILFLLFSAVHILTNAQDFSNKGKDFWIIYTGHVDGLTSRMALYITSDVNATGTIEVNGNIKPFTVTANQVTTIQFTQSSTPSNSAIYNGQLEGIGTKKGIHVTSDKPIVVYSHILNSARSGSTLVLPTNVLGKEYYVSSYNPISLTSADRSEFAIVAVVDNTIVEITPTGSDAAGVHNANIPFQITLNKGDVYQYQSNYDLTGTHIKSIGTASVSCQPIAVFSGSTRSFLGCANPNSGDNLYQQLFPFASWGKLYYTAPFIRRAYDVFRIIVKDTNTVVTVNGVAISRSKLINGRFYEINTQGNNVGQVIAADQPICVFQYMISQGCDNIESDPEMIILNAADQTLNDITVMSARNDLTPPNTNIDNHYLNIIYKTSTFSSLKIDGRSPTAVPKAIAGTGYSYVQEDVTGSTSINPSHHITSDSGFICIAYGAGNIESYGYNAGTNVIDRYQYLTSNNLYASVNFPATCRYAPFYFSLTLPYQPTALNWNFFNNPNLTPNNNISINNPVPDSTFVRDGKTLYRFKLNSIYTYAQLGTFPVQVTAQNPTPEGCSGTQEINYDMVVYEKPKVDFTYPENNCLGDTILFNDATNGNGRPVIKWNWSFGNGNFATIKNPIQYFATPGTYNVQLQTITDIGCIADTVKSITISTIPTVRFNVSTPACTGNAITFKDSSSSATGNIIKWFWNFGDGTTYADSSQKEVSHIYTNSGNYKITLTVQTTAGCTNSLSKYITINTKPVANFIAPEVCLNDAFAQFTDSSYIPGSTAPLLTYFWNFGDANATTGNPNTSIVKNPLHKYTSTGSYTATLIVTTNAGCIDTVSKVFQVNGSYPTAGFSLIDSTLYCTNKSVKIKEGSTVFPGIITKIVINWDAPQGAETDDTPSAGKIYEHQYPFLLASKNYRIKLTAYSGQTCFDSISKIITMNPSPKVDFNPVPFICYNTPPRLIIQGTETTGITGTGAYIGDGINNNGLFNPAFINFSGTSTTIPLMYSFKASNGCTDSDTGSVTIYKVSVDAGKDMTILEGESATLNPTVDAINPAYNWSPAAWLNSPLIKNPISSTKDNITYKLTVTDNFGCSANDTVAIRVLKEPVIPNAFSPNGDGINDTWNIKYLSTYSRAVVQIYNRYGSLVFNTIGYDKPWNGTYNGNPLPTGTYYYMISPGSGRRTMSGWLTLLR